MMYVRSGRMVVGFIALITVPLLGGSAAGAESAAAIPDFSGIWAHLTFPDVEPPLKGAGPVRNLSRVTTELARTLAPYNGAATVGASPNGVSNLSELVGDFTNPILKPEAAEVVKQHGEISKKGIAYPTPSNQCWPGGVPFVFWNIGMQMLQQKDKVTILYSNDHEVRHVRMNQPHLAQVAPSWYGDSVGHYEGDTLVIDTVGIKNGPFAMLDMYGTPFTEKLHVVERYRLVAYDDAKDAIERNAKENWRAGGGGDFDPNYRGKVLQLHFTVEDEGVFTMPWTATITYRPALGKWTDLICAENSREYYNDKDTEIPMAHKPDF